MSQKRSSPTQKLASLFLLAQGQDEMAQFLEDFLTPNERHQLLERWQIIDGLLQGNTQRAVRDDLKVSISKVSRGAAVLESGTGAFQKLWKRSR